MTDRRLAINSALRAAYDELDRLEGCMSIPRAAKTRSIMSVAFKAQYENGYAAGKTDKDAAPLAYDEKELERRYGG